MEQHTYIKHLLKAIAGSGNNDIIFQAEVIEVKGVTCTIKEGNTIIENVYLLASQYNGNDTFLIKPKIGSTVIVADLSSGNRRNMAVITFTAIDEIIINDGKNEGIPIGSKIVEWMNNVANDLATLQQLLLTSPITGNGAPASIQFIPKTKSITINEIENKIIRH